MKLLSSNLTRTTSGMTLAEVMITSSVFILLWVGMIQFHLFGLISDNLTAAKLGASDESRQMFNKLLYEIRSSKVLRVGTVAVDTNALPTAFAPLPNGTNQEGNGLQINLTASTTNFIWYYFETNAAQLRRFENGATNATVVCSYLTNSMLFRSEDFQGNVLTAYDNHQVINVRVQFYQFVFPVVQVGGEHGYFDSYKAEFKAARRNYD
jgi:hypothetical protein